MLRSENEMAAPAQHQCNGINGVVFISHRDAKMSSSLSTAFNSSWNRQ